ncbi:hypothetical protein ABH931_007717 [Streptacidiphilus sp. MAP12-33]|uniref:helix-turn-helix domain-containing protein n=1 Tax=Streptacidiphilus sp. MAP12-33 TaxID=3156266 RepID=UPI00351545CE
MARALRRVVDEVGNTVPTAPYLYSGWHTTADKRRVRAICSSKAFTPAEKFLVLWFIGSTPPGMMPVNMTATAIAEEVGMTADSVSRMLRKLAKHRIIVNTGQIGRIRMYSISPYIAFHGPGIEQREAVKSWNPPDIPGWTDTPAHERWEEPQR